MKQTLTRALQREKIAVVRREGRMIIRIFKVTEPGVGGSTEGEAESEDVKGLRTKVRQLSLEEVGDRKGGREDQVLTEKSDGMELDFD